jgi:pyruvate dehydrogenase complex dehydrogenase (E1) component
MEYVAASGVFGGIAHGPYLNFGRAGRDTDHDLEIGGEEAAPPAACLLYEAAYHHLRRVEVGDDSVAQRAYGL